MNPFDLRGPEFLGFYVGLCGVVFTVIAGWAWRLGRNSTGVRFPREPYAIAFVRGGSTEAARVAVLSLLARSLVRTREGRLGIERSDVAASEALHPIERAALHAVERGVTLRRVAKDRAFLEALADVRAGLEADGALPSKMRVDRFRRAAVVAAVVLLGTPVVKLAVAFARGRSNVEFLIVLTALALFALRALVRWRIASLGARPVREMRALFRNPRAVRAMGSSLRSDRETLIQAAVLGIVGGPFGHSRPSRGSSPDSSGHGCGGFGGCGGGGGGGSGCGGGGCGGCGASG